MKQHLALIFILGFCMDQALTLTLPPIPLPPFRLCNLANSGLQAVLQSFSSVSLSYNNYLPLGITGATSVDMFIENVTITGLESLQLDCPASFIGDVMTDSKYVCHLPISNLLIDISYYNISGHLDTVELYGEGTGFIKIDNFTAAVYGPTNNNYEFESVLLDLWMYRWMVNFDGIMPGTDMQYLFNEFLSMVGNEMIDGLEAAINKNEEQNLLKLVNFVVRTVTNTFYEGATKEPTTTATPTATATTSPISGDTNPAVV